jgi:hypothetical protein
MCELLHERIKQVTNSKKGPPAELAEAISSVIWCSNMVDITELQEVKQQMKLKYGAKFLKDALENE